MPNTHPDPGRRKVVEIGDVVNIKNYKRNRRKVVEIGDVVNIKNYKRNKRKTSTFGVLGFVDGVPSDNQLPCRFLLTV
jgi:hypothetical protein